MRKTILDRLRETEPYPYRVVVYRMLKQGRGVKGTVLAEVKCTSYCDAVEKKHRLQAEHGINGVAKILPNKER